MAHTHTATLVDLQVVPKEHPLLVYNWFPALTIQLYPPPIPFSPAVLGSPGLTSLVLQFATDT